MLLSVPPALPLVVPRPCPAQLCQVPLQPSTTFALTCLPPHPAQSGE